MSWLKLDDRFFDNPKIVALSDAAQLSYIKGAAYCARELTDGFIPMRRAREFANPKVIKELVPTLWEPATDGYMVHDYLDYNPTKAKVEAERKKARQRMFDLRSPERSPERSGEHPANNGVRSL